MFLGLLATIIFCKVYTCEGSGVGTKPCSFPIPLELPNRNDRSDQCWLRIEDVELTETLTVHCYVAQEFLRNYIHDYNSIKMTEDSVDVSLWSEDARPQNDIVPKIQNDPKGIKDWKLTTVMDPITHMRLYVTKNADCRLIMYSREGMTNYKVNCERLLYYFNERTYGGGEMSRAHFTVLFMCVFLVLISTDILI